MTLRVCAACTAAYAVDASRCPQCGSTDRAEDRVTKLPTLRVACAWDGCRYQGVVREVRLQPVGVGLVQKPALLCAACGTDPQTISGWPPIPEEEEDDVPKITRHGGPSNADAETPGEHEPGPVAPPEGNAAEPTDGDATAAEDKTTKAKTTRKPRARRAADSTGTTGLKVTAEADVTRGEDQ